MRFFGIITAVGAFVTIGLFHPIVIKCEYHFGKGCWPFFLVAGVVILTASLFVPYNLLAALLGAIGCSCLWSIKELFEQEKRVQRGWFPENPKRKNPKG